MPCFSDPYARVAFGTQSQVTEILTRTICPTWDQTLIFENVQIYGSVDKVARNPPEVIIELFDKDPVVSLYLFQPSTRCCVTSLGVQWSLSSHTMPPHLRATTHITAV